MSVRKRTWKNSKGDAKEAWVVDYVDQSGRRRLKTFKKKKPADAYHAQAHVDIREGTHAPDSASITIAEAADLWIESCEGRQLERSTIESYRQHVRFHIRPFLGKIKLSQVIAPLVRDFEVSISIERGPQICVEKGPHFDTGRNDSARPGAAVRLAQPGRVRWRVAGL